MSGTVLSYSEDAALAGELASAAGEIAKTLGGEAVALELDGLSPGLRTPNRVLVLKGGRPLESDPDSAAAALVEAAKQTAPKVLLVGETHFGTLVGAKVAAKLRMGALGKGKALRLEGDALSAQRDVYGGRFTATVAVSLPCVAVVHRGAYLAEDHLPDVVDDLPVSVEEPRVVEVEVRREDVPPSGVRSASVIVSAGRGFAKKEDLALAKDLADALGAALGCSRPLSSELGWLGEDAHIGLSGAYVHPKLYIAVGISGQLQHVAGIKDSKVIVAINKDPNAPIFQVADYGIVGDLYDVLPALTEKVKQRSRNL